MAKSLTNFPYLGTLNNVTSYKMRGCDDIIFRMKGGPSREQIKMSDKFENTRRNNSEFGGRATTSGWIMKMIQPLKVLGDHNIVGPFNSLLRRIQVMDEVSAHGQRSVCLSREPRILMGFSLNKKNPFDTIIRTPVNYELDRAGLKASLDIPALVPRINFFVPWNYPYYGLQVCLGVIPDLFYDKSMKSYKPDHGYDRYKPQLAETEWYPVSEGSPATSLQLNWPAVPPDQQFSLVLSVGIRYGNIGLGNKIVQVKYGGAAKVLEVV
jgi:hypothetical protein